MVTYKRKPVRFVPEPDIPEEKEVWVIKETNEAFDAYDEFLARREWYDQKRFTCDITGHSGLNFFEAYQSETDAYCEVQDSFPDPLREPILRKVQHSTISRIDALVDHVYEEFKQDFYPGENVIVVLEGHEKLDGTVREKSYYPEVKADNGSVTRKAHCRYFVSLISKPDHEAIVDNEHIVRDRRAFTKLLLRSFLKLSLQREAWNGAPWEVKEHLADEYKIPTDIPEHLRHETKKALRKEKLTLKKLDLKDTSTVTSKQTNGLPELKPKSLKGKSATKDPAKIREEQTQELKKLLAKDPVLAKRLDTDEKILQHLLENYDLSGAPKTAPKEPALPPIKYPIEDLDLELQETVRPQLKFLHTETSTSQHEDVPKDIVGTLLETWNTLNVYCEVFQLDSFTFDDYVEALRFQTTEVHCELLAEIHCALLMKLVSGDSNGQVHIEVPETEESEDEEMEDEEERTRTPTPEPEKPARRTRRSLAKTEAAEVKAQEEAEAKIHNGQEIDQCVKGHGWRERIQHRDFANGRWIIPIIGLLNIYTLEPWKQAFCEEILKAVAPPHLPATEEDAIAVYAQLDISTRANILQFLCMLTIETPSIRSYMDDCQMAMTQYRKDKVEHQKKRKALMEDLRQLDIERVALQPEASTPAAEIEELNTELKEEDPDKTVDEDGDVTMGSDEDAPPQRSLRRGDDRAAERRQRREQERIKKEKAKIEKANKPTKEARQLEKLMKKIDAAKAGIKHCEDEIAVIDDDLREADCQRTRVLGKDRFLNRYYWFERNAMPYAGLPDSSTADAGYANGCVWVQGPDAMEGLCSIDQEKYENRTRTAPKISVSERKAKEEGGTHVDTPMDWGYFDDPDDLDKLIAWLNEKGLREAKLKREMLNQRENIATYMEKRSEYLDTEQTKRSESVEPVARISTRNKTYVDSSGFRFMAWRNTTARRENGHLHSEPLKSSRRGGVARMNSGIRKSVEEPTARQTRESNRRGKGTGRYGTRSSL